MITARGPVADHHPRPLAPNHLPPPKAAQLYEGSVRVQRTFLNHMALESLAREEAVGVGRQSHRPRVGRTFVGPSNTSIREESRRRVCQQNSRVYSRTVRSCWVFLICLKRTGRQRRALTAMSNCASGFRPVSEAVSVRPKLETRDNP